MRRRYLVLMDAVPGGTGFLKALFVPKTAGERAGEGIMSVLRLALNALESCDCRVLGPALGQDDTDGCYRCIRAYHLQYKAEEISRERGITLLRAMIEAGERRTRIDARVKARSLPGMGPPSSGHQETPTITWLSTTASRPDPSGSVQDA